MYLSDIYISDMYLSEMYLSSMYVSDTYLNSKKDVCVCHNLKKLLKNYNSGNEKMFHYHYYTLYKLIRNKITRLNRHIIDITNRVLSAFEQNIEKISIIQNAVDFIEKNESLLKFQ